MAKKYWWMDAEYPLLPATDDKDDDREVLWEHLETLRKYCWLKSHLDAGAIMPDPVTVANGALTNSTWEDWCDEFNPTEDFPTNEIWNELCDINFIGTSETLGDTYSAYQEFSSMTDLKNNPPVSSVGVFNSQHWRKVVNYNFYKDWDNISGRWDIGGTARGSSSTWRINLCDRPGYYRLPRQTSPYLQKKKVKYLDTEREIFQHWYDEHLWRYITQPFSLGPTSLDWDYVWESTWQKKKYSMYISGEEITGTPDQYSQYNAEPGNTDGAKHDDSLPEIKEQDEGTKTQWQYDPKICFAYQNYIEHLAGTGNWAVPIKSDAWSTEYILNYNRKIVRTQIPWSASKEYSQGDFCQYNDIKWRCWVYGLTDTPGTSSDWVAEPLYGEDYTTTPRIADANDELWGCNSSAFELFLWMTGNYDWWFDTGTKWSPQLIKYIRADLAKAGESSSDINDWYPLSVGTWRRTWRYSMGRVHATTMRPQSKGIPQDYEPYTSYQEDLDYISVMPQQWPGIFTPATPDFTLTTEEEEELVDRHDPSFVCGYELGRRLLNEIWYVLEQMTIKRSNVTLDMQARNGTGSVSSQSSYANAYAGALSNANDNYDSRSWFNSSFNYAMIYTYGAITRTGASSFSGSMQIQNGRIKMTGGYRNGIYSDGSKIFATLKINNTPFSYAAPAQKPTITPITFYLPGAQSLVILEKSYDYVTESDPGDDTYRIPVEFDIPPVSDRDYETHINYFPIVWTGEMPYGSLPSSGDPWMDNIRMRAEVSIEQAYMYDIWVEIDWDFPDTEVFDTERYVEFEEVAVDDELFDTNGDLYAT